MTEKDLTITVVAVVTIATTTYFGRKLFAEDTCKSKKRREELEKKIKELENKLQKG